MSSVFRISLQRKQQAPAIKSPLARLTAGKLRCQLCSTVVARGASALGDQAVAAWGAHEKSDEHRQQAELVRAQVQNKQKRTAAKAEEVPVVPPKRLRGILKNAFRPPTPPSVQRAETESEAEQNGTVKKDDVAKEDKSSKAGKKRSGKKNSKKEDPEETDEALPEGFFDDPIMDAKARNIPYKNPIEEEWEKFQKEMKEEVNLSAAIVAGEREEAATERQIDEIEEQIRNLSKVLDLNKKKEEVAKQKALQEANIADSKDTSSGEEEDFEEYLDWRAKKSFR